MHTIKFTTCMLILLTLNVSSVLAASSLPRVAKVNMNLIYNELGHQRIIALNMEPDVRNKIQQLKNKAAKAMLDLINEENEDKIDRLKKTIQTINSKLSTIQSVMNKTRNRDYRASLRTYIRKNFSNNYDLILDTQSFGRNNNAIVHDAGKITDITDQVVKKLSKELI